MDPSEDSTVESEDAVEGRRGMSSASSFDRPESDDIDLAGSPGIAFAVFFFLVPKAGNDGLRSADLGKGRCPAGPQGGGGEGGRE